MAAIVKATNGGDERYVVCQAAPDSDIKLHVQIFCPEFGDKNRDYGLAFDIQHSGLRQQVQAVLQLRAGVIARSLTGSDRLYLLMQMRPLSDNVLAIQMLGKTGGKVEVAEFHVVSQVCALVDELIRSYT